MKRRAARRQVVARAHAKINVDLRILGVRPDGFHELRTVFQTLALHDVVTCEARRGPFAIHCQVAGVPLDERNLVWKAATALWRSQSRRADLTGVVVHIDKRIPLEAGLGGGSADAAATLLALARLWRVPRTSPVLSEIAASLGADVAFFLTGGTALGLGRGEEVYPLADLPRYWVLLLVPAFGVSTAEAYRWWDADHAAGLGTSARVQVLPGPWSWHAAHVINDLEAPIARRHAEIEVMTAALRGTGARMAAMTGSGSTVFGLFRRRVDAERAARQCRGKAWRVVLTRSLDRAAYEGLSRPRARVGAAFALPPRGSLV